MQPQAPLSSAEDGSADQCQSNRCIGFNLQLAERLGPAPVLAGGRELWHILTERPVSRCPTTHNTSGSARCDPRALVLAILPTWCRLPQISAGQAPS